MNILRIRFPNLIKRFKDHNLRPDNNIAENVVKQLNQKFKKVVGFESYETAYNSIKLLVMRYRFHTFNCSRMPGNSNSLVFQKSYFKYITPIPPKLSSIFLGMLVSRTCGGFSYLKKLFDFNSPKERQILMKFNIK